MAIVLKGSSPAALLAKVREQIDARSIVTWEYDADGDFTHTPTQWRNQAWLRPEVFGPELRFGLVGQKDTPMKTGLYGVYHGRFIEMLLTHFDTEFSSVMATANKADPDTFTFAKPG